MNGRELVLKTMRHEKTERTPWVPFVGVHAGKIIGKDAKEMLTDEENLYTGVTEAVKLYHADGIPVMFDLQVEAEILGCGLVWAKKAPPSVKTHPLEDTDEIPCLCKVPKKTDGRLPMILKVMERLKKDIGNETALYGLICGPFTLASHLRGNDIFMDMYDDEEYTQNLINFANAACKAVAKMYIEAGMDVIAVVDPLVSQISPDHFSDFLNAPYTELFDFIREKGTFSSFFVCGNATRNIEEMCKTGPDCISVDENVDLVKAKEIANKYNIVMAGNIPLTTIMLHGTQQDNMKYVVDLMDKIDDKRNLILSPGCDMPFDIPLENAIAAGQAVINTDSARKMIENYEAVTEDIEVELPDYKSLKKPLIEVCTLDSETCAACTYMYGSAMQIKEYFGDKIDVVEYKYTRKEDIARFVKMGVKQLPSIYINGELAYSSIIPAKAEFIEKVENAIKALN